MFKWVVYSFKFGSIPAAYATIEIVDDDFTAVYRYDHNKRELQFLIEEYEKRSLDVAQNIYLYFSNWLTINHTYPRNTIGDLMQFSLRSIKKYRKYHEKVLEIHKRICGLKAFW